MGECGCGYTSPDYRFPGPAGVTYAVQLYGGCKYCGTPVGIIIYRFGERAAQDFADGVPEAKFDTYVDGSPTGEFSSVNFFDRNSPITPCPKPVVFGAMASGAGSNPAPPTTPYGPITKSGDYNSNHVEAWSASDRAVKRGVFLRKEDQP